MYSNAAKRVGLGYGGICQNSWMFGKWTDAFLNEKDPSIEYLELYTLVGMVMNLIHRFCNRRIILFCDNQTVVHMVNNMSSSCKNCIVLIRKLVLNSLCDNVCFLLDMSGVGTTQHQICSHAKSFLISGRIKQHGTYNQLLYHMSLWI